jgi:single-strand DNA-binding protein
MASVNKVILIGNLGKDPEIRTTPQGTTLARFSVATSTTWKDASGAKQERTEWHDIVAWEKLAQICGEYLQKGKQVYVEGSLQTRSWEDQNGQKRYKTEVKASNVVMLGRREEGMRSGSSAREVAEAPEPATRAPGVTTTTSRSRIRGARVPAYVIVDVEVLDPSGYERYKALATESIARHGGRYLARGGRAVALEGRSGCRGVWSCSSSRAWRRRSGGTRRRITLPRRRFATRTRGPRWWSWRAYEFSARRTRRSSPRRSHPLSPSPTRLRGERDG